MYFLTLKMVIHTNYGALLPCKYVLLPCTNCNTIPAQSLHFIYTMYKFPWRVLITKLLKKRLCNSSLSVDIPLVTTLSHLLLTSLKSLFIIYPFTTNPHLCNYDYVIMEMECAAHLQCKYVIVNGNHLNIIQNTINNKLRIHLTITKFILQHFTFVCDLAPYWGLLHIPWIPKN